ncbi:MAG TPA: hypothetical protein VKZ63_14630 [Kofleriaceae bacterium]|nr:hypothetical protein [Kofleriaceae bacterium]
MGAWVRRPLSCAAIGSLLAGCLDAPSPPGVGGGGGDGGGGGGDGGCGGLGVLSDPFEADAEGGELDAWEVTGDVAVAGGALALAGGDGRAAVSSREWVLPHGAVVVGPVSLASGSALELVVTDAGGGFARIAAAGGALRFEAGGEEVAALEHEPAQQAYWRVELRQGEVAFASSPDGSDWDDRGAAPLAMDGLVQVNLALAAGEEAAAEIGGVNPGGAAGRCPLADLVDDFGRDTGAWLEEFEDDCVARIDQRLEIVHPGFDIACLVRSARRYRMDGDAVSVVPVLVPAGGAPSVDLMLRAPGGVLVGLHLHDEGGIVTLECQRTVPDDGIVESSAVSWQPEAMARWRLRRVAGSGRIVCEAEDLAGEEVIAIGDVSGPELDHVEVLLGSAEYTSEPVTVAFDDVNTP